MIIRDWLLNSAAGSGVSLSEAQTLLAAVMHVSKTWLISHDQDPIPDELLATVNTKLSSLQLGVPLPYLTGVQEFYGLKFSVSPAVLIPRPETELLVQLALEWLNDQTSAVKAMDIGTGSGCIPISIMCHNQDVRFLATDISVPALKIATENATAHGVKDRVEFVQTDLCDGINLSDIHLVCANLPYIPTREMEELTVTRFEPKSALDGGMDGLKLVRRLISSLSGKLKPPYCILLEIEYRQGDSVQKLAREAFPDGQVRLHPDLAGLPRIVQITRTK